MRQLDEICQYLLTERRACIRSSDIFGVGARIFRRRHKARNNTDADYARICQRRRRYRSGTDAHCGDTTRDRWRFCAHPLRRSLPARLPPLCPCDGHRFCFCRAHVTAEGSMSGRRLHGACRGVQGHNRNTNQSYQNRWKRER